MMVKADIHCRSLTREIKTDTTEIKEDTTAIKQDTAQILEEIADRKSTRLNSSHLGISYQSTLFPYTTLFRSVRGAQVCIGDRFGYGDSVYDICTHCP